MNGTNLFKIALRALANNKLRAFLTMLGIIIGIAAVIAIETVGNSMTGSVTDSMAGMGASNISVSVVQKSVQNILKNTPQPGK